MLFHLLYRVVRFQKHHRQREWTRTAGPDESIVLTGHQLSRFSGQEEGKDTRFLVYGSGGVTKTGPSSAS